VILLYYNYIELAAFLLAIIFFADLKKFKIGGYVLYLFVVCVTEITATNIIGVWGIKSNYPIYNVYMVFATAISLYIFYQILNYRGFVKKIYWGLSILSVCFILFDLFYLQGFIVYDTYSNTVNTLVSIILPILVLIKLFISDDTKVKLIDNPYFWICAGTLIFNLCDLLILGLQQFIAVKQITIGGIMLYKVIMPVFCAVLYGCLCYSFILCRKQTTRLLLS
jgi:hypothetical protein